MSVDAGSVAERARPCGVRAVATAELDASRVILEAVLAVTQPPQLKPTIAKVIAPTIAPWSEGTVHLGSSKKFQPF